MLTKPEAIILKCACCNRKMAIKPATDAPLRLRDRRCKRCGIKGHLHILEVYTTQTLWPLDAQVV